MRNILDGLERVPSLPGQATALIAALMDPHMTNRRLETHVRADEGLTAAVLRRANSAAFGAAGQVFDLNASIVRLGSRPLMRIALEQQMTEMLGSAGHSYGLRRREAWTGAMFGALAAECIAGSLDSVDPSLAFSAALLRDVGKLAIDTLLDPEESALLGTQASDEGRSYLEVERERLGADHAQIGGALVERWNLPGSMAAAIRAHHEPAPPGSEAHETLHDVVHAADVLTLWAGLATGHDGLRYELAPHVQKGILRTNRRVESLMADTWNRFREAADATGTGDGSKEDAA